MSQSASASQKTKVTKNKREQKCHCYYSANYWWTKKVSEEIDESTIKLKEKINKTVKTTFGVSKQALEEILRAQLLLGAFSQQSASIKTGSTASPSTCIESAQPYELTHEDGENRGGLTLEKESTSLLKLLYYS